MTAGWQCNERSGLLLSVCRSALRKAAHDRFRAGSLALLCLTCVQAGATDQVRLPLDPSRSSVRFQIPLLLFGQVQGQFSAVHGELTQIADGWRVCADVAVSSASMRRDKDRAELLGPSFFHAQRHPRLSFVSDLLPPGLPIAGTVLPGKLSVRGYTRATRFVLQEVQCPDPESSAGCRFSLHGAIRRSDFGMRARPAVLGNKVSLQLEIAVCDKSDAACAAAAAVGIGDCTGQEFTESAMPLVD